jgi:membrane protein implicated in regulation of membrane protease activity
MPGFSLLTDLITSLIVYVCAAALTLRWIHRTDQVRVPRNPDVTRLVIGRLAVVVGGLFVACWLSGIAVWVPVLAMGLLMLFALVGDALGLPGVVVFWVVQQYVLGFPARDDLFLTPPASMNREHSEPVALMQLVGQNATTLSPLKPTGEIILGDARYTAASESGGYLRPGEVVVISGVKDGRLLVRWRNGTQE